MSAKVANVIAIELGVLIALLAWLAVARVPSIRPLPRAQAPAQTDRSFATVAPVRRSSPQNLYAAGDVADAASAVPELAEPAQAATQEYAQELPGSDYAEDVSVAETTAYYPAVEQVPVVIAPDYYVAPVAQVVEFVQPRQFIVYSNTRSFRRTNRSPDCGRVMVGRQRPGGNRVFPRNGGVPPRQHAGAPRVRPNPGSGGSVGPPRGGNRTPSRAGNGRAGGRPISVLH